eukprot:GFUD01033132.1.p1 GENE.GFUD01033132.1~~GFUD01033132.1.p1  ORF type:complete len:1173 (+),score=394.18 GFUD01033132.1:178-3696(+)
MIMNTLFLPLLLCLSVQSQGYAQSTGQCQPPRLDNGVVEAEEGDQGNFFNAKFRCNPGFTLSGPDQLKCRSGKWSGNKPVCTVSGCDPADLPRFVNGKRVKVKGMRDSVFRYKCNKGFRLFGPKNVYCTKSGWKMDNIPVCARYGCDEAELLGNGIPHGRKRSMFQGAVYRFYCESGSMMEGNSAVFCDGYSWNGTKPECLVPPTTPEISIELDGVEASEPLAAIGQQLKLVCRAQGGNPFPSLAFMLNGERVEADNKEMIEHGYNAVHTFTVEEHHANLEMFCIAENKMTSIPIASNHQTLGVKSAPQNTYIHGADMVKPGDAAEYSCTSDESNPASELAVQITDQDGNEIPIEMTNLPKMKVSTGFASKLEFKFHVETHFKSIFMKCEATNVVGRANTGMSVHVMFPPSNIKIFGPDHLLGVDDQSQPNNLFSCSSDESNPVATIEWVVDADGVIETIPEDSTAVETFNQGLGWMKISTLLIASPLADTVKVHCVVSIEDLDFTESSDELLVDVLTLPGEVSIAGPEFVLLNSVSDFECVLPEDDTESVVTMHVMNLQMESVEFAMESDNKISVTTQEPMDSFIVECFAENLAGRGPAQTKRVDVLYPPQVEIEGPAQLLPFTQITYSCSTTKNSAAHISWTLTDEDGADVAFTELSSHPDESADITSVIETYVDERYQQLTVGCLASSGAGEGYSEIVAHAVESPKSVEIIAPDYLVAGSELDYECTSPVSSPQQTLRWEVTDGQGESLQFYTEDTEVLDGQVSSLLYITAQASARTLTVKCVARNFVGYVEDVSHALVTYDPEDLHLTGPTSVLASDEAVFLCSSEVSYPAPFLQWSLDGQDVTRDAEQTDNVEDDGGITSNSVLKLKPTMGGLQHVIKCSVGGKHISKELQFNVEDLVEEEYEYEEDTYSDEDEYDYGEEYTEQEYNHETEENNDELEEYNNEYKTNNNDEKENNAKEEEYSGQEEEYNSQEDEYNVEDEYNGVEDEHNGIEDEYNEVEDEYNGDDEYNLVEDKYNGIEDEFHGAEEDHIGEKEEKGDEDYNFEEEEYTEEDADAIFEESSEYDSRDSYDVVSNENPNDIENKEVQDATNNQKDNYNTEDPHDATHKEQSFAAAETGSAVLSHDSDASSHNSADLFSSKQLYSSSHKTWPCNVLISIIIGNIIRLLS